MMRFLQLRMPYSAARARFAADYFSREAGA
jgi:hypothetical protein